MNRQFVAGNACIPQTAGSIHEAMLFSTQNIHLDKYLRYSISFLYNNIPKVNHLPIYIQKLMQRVNLHGHNHLSYTLVWSFQMPLPESLRLSESDYWEQCTQKI